MKDTQDPAKGIASGTTFEGFTDEGRAAMKARATELKTSARRGPRAAKADGESDLLARIAEMPESDRVMAERLHAVVKASARPTDFALKELTADVAARIGALVKKGVS